MSAADGPRVTACPDGPLLVRGPFELVDESGEPIDPLRRTVALCRCGSSAIRPFCDGTHKRIGFRTTPPARTPAVLFDGSDAQGAESAAGHPSPTANRSQPVNRP